MAVYCFTGNFSGILLGVIMGVLGKCASRCWELTRMDGDGPLVAKEVYRWEEIRVLHQDLLSPLGMGSREGDEVTTGSLLQSWE